MDKWEKVITLKRKLTDLRHGLSLEELQYCLECDRATVYRIKDLAEMLFGIDISPITHLNQLTGFISYIL